MAMIVRDEDGLTCPIFKDGVSGRRQRGGGWETNSFGTLMDGPTLSKCWPEA